MLATRGSQTSDPRPILFERTILFTITLSAFGPYLAGSIRTEHIVVYGLAALVFPFAITRLHVSGGVRFVAPWAAYIVMALLGSVLSRNNFSPWESGSLLAGLDNLLLPLTTLLLVWCVIRGSSAVPLLRSFSTVVVWCAAANAVIAGISTRVDLTPALRPFWGLGEGVTATADYAAQLGRYTGIFNQPSEAGLFYGVAALLVIYAYSRQPKRMAVLLALISIGGLLSVSKIFILGGIPLILFSVWRSKATVGRFGGLLAAGLVIWGFIQSGFFSEWLGANYLARFLSAPEAQNVIEFYSAGRWNEGSSVREVIGAVLETSPIVGVGPAGWRVAYDSGWVEAAVVAGVTGVACLALIHVNLFILANRTFERSRRLLFFLLATLLFGSSFGIPSLTVNRAATIVWISLALLVRALGEEVVDPNLRSKRHIINAA